MSLLCGKNAAIESIKSKIGSLKGQILSGKGALGSLGSIAGDIKSGISGLKASVKNLTSFQSELSQLAGAGAAQIAAFKLKWAGKVTDLEGFIDKVTKSASLDFCKDVPNVNLDPAGAVVNLAKTSPMPNIGAADISQLKSTVVDQFKKTTSGKAGLIPAEVKSAFDTSVMKTYRDQVVSPLADSGKGLAKAVSDAADDKSYVSVMKKMRGTGKVSEQLIADGLLTSDEISSVNAYRKAEEKLENYSYARSKVEEYWRALGGLSAGSIPEKEIVALEKRNAKDLKLADYGSFFSKARSVFDGNREAIRKSILLSENRSST